MEVYESNCVNNIEATLRKPGVYFGKYTIFFKTAVQKS
jgi:hypothetical protein